MYQPEEEEQFLIDAVKFNYNCQIYCPKVEREIVTTFSPGYHYKSINLLPKVTPQINVHAAD